MQEKISVIVPVYKAEKYLNRCIESIVCQTYTNIEIILVDDSSPDRCPEMCDEWAEKDKRIKVIHKQNDGALAARLAGVESSCGDYVAFADSDDWLDKNALSHLHSLITSGEYDIACCGYHLTHGESDLANDEKENVKALDFDLMMKNLYSDSLWSLWGKLYRKRLFGQFDKETEDLTVCEDLYLNYQIFKKASQIIVTSKKMYYYFRHSESIMGTPVNKTRIEDSMKAYRLIYNDIDKSSDAFLYHTANTINNDLMLLNRIVIENRCWEYYKILRKEIVSLKKYIFNEKNKYAFPFKHKAAVVLFLTLPKLYNRFILIKK